jgi:uncharacterized C2H2 Zn-finger protein
MFLSTKKNWCLVAQRRIVKMGEIPQIGLLTKGGMRLGFRMQTDAFVASFAIFHEPTSNFPHQLVVTTYLGAFIFCVNSKSLKMSYCGTCNRSFNTYNGYIQHVNNSAAHQTSYEQDWDCDACNRSFATKQSLHQHCSSAMGHPYCIPCKRMFSSEHN